MGKNSFSNMRRAKKHKRKSKLPQRFISQRFSIESIDPLGQGVARDGDNIIFIHKTLPKETVQAQVVKKKKGVNFARLESVDVAADNRLEPGCEHYDDCPGCHFLHTDYASELTYKKQNLARMFAKLGVSEGQIKVTGAPKRERYRNRIQLHFRDSTIGLIDGLSDRIVEIPNCRIIRDELVPVMSALYRDKSWTDTNKGEGHCELYFKDGMVSQAWNSPYAHGGFTQVFEDMNDQLCESVSEYLHEALVSSVLDLFAGDGNLSRQYSETKNVNRVLVDLSENSNSTNFIRLDLFSSDALQRFQAQCKEKQFDAILLDPPRKGFSALSDWIKIFKARKLIYVSCNATTMIRDLSNLHGSFAIDRVELLDLFPGTFHFETICFISLRK